MKQSNWILGIGIVVALLIIVGSLFYAFTAAPATNAVEQSSGGEIGQVIRHIGAIPINKLSNIINSIQ